jgi:hypothetical protein
MPRIRSIPFGLILAMLVLASRCFAANEPSPWLEIHSTHFTVITDAGEKKGREVALRFEQMRSVFGTLLGKERLNQPVPMTIFAFKSDKTYYQLAPLAYNAGSTQGQPTDIPGFFLPGDDQDFIALNLFEPEPWRAVAHDFAHMLLNYNYPPTQGWFDEGLAEYFSSIRVDDKRVQIGGDPELQASVTEDLLGNQHEAHPSKSLTELLGAQVWLSIPDLFTMRHDTSTYNEGTHHTLYYAESWMVMYYLLHQKKLPETGTYFDLVLNQHAPVEDAIQKAFGMSSAQLEQAVKDYFRSQSALLLALDAARMQNPNSTPANPADAEQTYQFPAPVGPEDSAITSKTLPEDDARALYAGVQVRIPDRREYGLKELQALATAATPAEVRAETKRQEEQKKELEDVGLLPTITVGNEIAHRCLAWDHIQRGEFDDALTELADAASLNHSDMWVRYYLSVLKYRMADSKHATMQGLPNMMVDLKAVLEWNAEFADAYDLLALARNEGGGAIAAMQAERAAMNLSPRDERYVYHMAVIYISSKKWEAAQSLLERLKASSNSQIAGLARERLSQIASERKYGLMGATLPQPKYEAQKSPFDVLEQDAAKRTADEKTSQAGPADARPTKYVQGRLLAVDCSQAPTAILTVTSEGAQLKLRAGDYKSLLLIGADDFSCSWRDRKVSVNYKPGGLADGDVVSLEMR